MLPADVIAEIIANLAALNLQPSTAATVLGALAPLLRTAETPPPAALEPPPRSSRRPRASKRPRGAPRRRKYNRRAPTEARDRALAALKANPNASTTELAASAGVSRSTVVNARDEIEKQGRKARKAARETSTPAKPREPRERAQRFLREQLARGAKPASFVEDAAEKAHVEPRALEQARVELGVVTSRSNAGGVQAVQWSLPG
jgi:transposase